MIGLRLRLGFIEFGTTRSLSVLPTEPGVRVAASPWAWDRRQPPGWGILVTASRSALWVLRAQLATGSRWAQLNLKRRSHLPETP